MFSVFFSGKIGKNKQSTIVILIVSDHVSYVL